MTWIAPPTGGAAITGYTINAFNGATLVYSTVAAANAVSVNITGLADTTVYRFEVTATNAIGPGPPGKTRPVTVGMVEIRVPTFASSLYFMTAGEDGRVWFTEADSNNLAAAQTCGVIVEYPVPTASSFPYGIAAGPDHGIWFTELIASKIGRSTVNGSMTEFTIPTASSQPEGIAPGADGALWFVERAANKIGRITTAGTVTNEIAIPSSSSYSEFITPGPDSAMWFTERDANKIGRIALASPFTITEFTIPTASSAPQGIVLGPNGALWFTESEAFKIGRITTGGVFTEFAIPSVLLPLSRAITVGPDGALWFAEDNGNAIGRITGAGVVSEFPVTTQGAGPHGVAALGSQVWFTENLTGTVGYLPAGAGMPASDRLHSRSGACRISGGQPPTRQPVTPVPVHTPQPRGAVSQS